MSMMNEEGRGCIGGGLKKMYVKKWIRELYVVYCDIGSERNRVLVQGRLKVVLKSYIMSLIISYEKIVEII